MSGHTRGKWEVIEHSWSDTSIMADDHCVCRISIYDEATEDNQEELEKRSAKEARLIAAAPEALEALLGVAADWRLDDLNARQLVLDAIAKATGGAE